MFRINLLDKCLFRLYNLVNLRVILWCRECDCICSMWFFLYFGIVMFGLYLCRVFVFVMFPLGLVFHLLMGLFFDGFSLFDINSHLFKSLLLPTGHIFKSIIIFCTFLLILLRWFLSLFEFKYIINGIVKGFLNSRNSLLKKWTCGFLTHALNIT